MALNDFIRKYVDPDFVVEGRNVKMGVFARRPERYVTDPDLRGDILSVPAYQLLEDARKLAEHRVHCLQHWKEFDHREIVSNISWGKLDGALKVVEENEKAVQVEQERARREEEENKRREEERAKRIDEIVRQPLPDGFYASVFNAKCSHVLEFPEGEGNNMVVRMEVREGQPPAQLWDFTQYGFTLLPVEDAEQFIPPRPRLMILSSEYKWPYSLRQKENIEDCYINREVERVWKNVKGELTGLLRTKESKREIWPRVLVGAPGIGKSMSVGSYLLYKLLHYDPAKLQVVVHCFGGDLAFVFDKEKQTVTVHGSACNVTNLLYDLVGRGKRGFVIYDVDKKGSEPSWDYPPSDTWGIIVLSSPNEDNYASWKEQKGAVRTVMNCPEELDVKAMCAWATRNQSSQEQNNYWETVKNRIYRVGPIPQYIFNERGFSRHCGEVRSVLRALRASDVEEYFVGSGGRIWHTDNPFNEIVKVVREHVEGGEMFFSAVACYRLGCLSADCLQAAMKKKDFCLLALDSWRNVLSTFLEKCILTALTERAFVDAVVGNLKELRPSTQRETKDCVLATNPGLHPKVTFSLEAKSSRTETIDVNCGALYRPRIPNFPLVDAFFFVASPSGRKMVGLQFAAAKAHDTTASNLKLFNEHTAGYFTAWDTFAEGLSWESFDVQSRGSEIINTWQRCGNSANPGENENKKIAEFWEEKVYQYQVAVSDEDFKNIDNVLRRRQLGDAIQI
ncbi:retrotransposon hot spot (RHS) protein [Trypanosoma conorhini]|uniref:Retrotransposon hot spot (RHS) protein n=1 Tax=Trypanosoma conorhini TaxID=83891 RepID=A0A3R7M385_9TRYP|nr:retrotransposon hot spot (RHS) protein [Trypanosoma conorhini]RNE98580.1 retrotransposon hot spot (RHS) protein [Trypanosoma conorhini]